MFREIDSFLKKGMLFLYELVKSYRYLAVLSLLLFFVCVLHGASDASITAWATACLAVLTLVLAVSTCWMAYESKKMRELNSNPHVIIYPRADKYRATLIMLELKNIGNGPAYDIRVETSKELRRCYGWGSTPSASVDWKALKFTPMLAPNESRVFGWGQYTGICDEIGDEAIIAECYFSNGRKELKSISKLDITSFYYTQDTYSPVEKINKHLEQIEKNMKSIMHKLNF